MNHELQQQLENLDKLEGYKPIKDMIIKFALSIVPGRPRSDIFIFKGSNLQVMSVAAELMGKVLKAAGSMNTGHVVFCNRFQLVGDYIGETPIKTNSVIDSAAGGFLFVHDISDLRRDEGDYHGSDAIYQILKRLLDEIGLFSLILCDTPDRMETFLSMATGMRAHSTYVFNFDDISVP